LEVQVLVVVDRTGKRVKEERRWATGEGGRETKGENRKYEALTKKKKKKKM